MHTANPQQGDLRLFGPQSGQGAVGGARTCYRMVPADLMDRGQTSVGTLARSWGLYDQRSPGGVPDSSWLQSSETRGKTVFPSESRSVEDK
ncbi:hypothetical protein PoB_005011400 [Plakobranchus ocellatus]|uniref:Uncharacterized protein n=1 Tax=Plakobranchus ocellatus TaxID=259542 RepID=A0AAV4BZ00_9GAST|nr:hypothetical protein PoB_005011400 [Plakobranchus ocellatus]